MKKKPVSPATPSKTSSPQGLRLQRVLAAAGLGSRRDCETLITEGRVEVDGQPCTELGTKVDPETQEIRVDGERIRGQKLQYFMLNKPAGVLSTNDDPDGRTRVIDLIKTDLRVYNVGRLDQSSEGLIVVTNDGDLAFRLTHPKFGVEKRYLVQCVGCPTLEQLQQLERGVYLAEGKAKVERVSIKKKQRTGGILEMVLTEGRNREIRRVLAAIGHKVTRLKRIGIGPLQLGELAVGAHRRLTGEEIRALKQAAAGTAKRSPKAKRPTGPARNIGQLKAIEERPTGKAVPSSGRGRRIDRTQTDGSAAPTEPRSRNDQAITNRRSRDGFSAKRRPGGSPPRGSSGQRRGPGSSGPKPFGDKRSRPETPRRGPKRIQSPGGSRSSTAGGPADRGQPGGGQAGRGKLNRGNVNQGKVNRGNVSRGNLSRGKGGKNRFRPGS